MGHQCGGQKTTCDLETEIQDMTEYLAPCKTISISGGHPGGPLEDFGKLLIQLFLLKCT